MLRIGILAKKYEVFISLQQEHLASFKPKIDCLKKKNKKTFQSIIPLFELNSTAGRY